MFGRVVYLKIDGFHSHGTMAIRESRLLLDCTVMGGCGAKERSETLDISSDYGGCHLDFLT